MNDKELQLIQALITLGFTYITRDEDNCLVAWEKKPIKYSDHWFYSDFQSRELSNYYDFYEEDIFTNVQWSNDTPTEIVKLLKE